MTWSSLSHATNGLILAYGLMLFALIATLIQQRGGARAVLVSPILAVPCGLIDGLLAAAVATVISAPTMLKS
jgi:hypothetical protein